MKNKHNDSDLSFTGKQGKKTYVIVPSTPVNGIPRISVTPRANLKKSNKKVKRKE